MLASAVGWTIKAVSARRGEERNEMTPPLTVSQTSPGKISDFRRERIRWRRLGAEGRVEEVGVGNLTFDAPTLQ